MLILTIPFSGPVNWDLLKEQAAAAYPPGVFVDCNATNNNTSVTVYLNDGQSSISTSAPSGTGPGVVSPLANAQIVWQGLISNHNANQLSPDQQKQADQTAAAAALASLDKSTLDPTIANILRFLKL